MNQEFLPAIYLGTLLILLGALAIFVFKQILKTRRVEKTFSTLKEKLIKESGTPKEYYELGSLYLDKKLYSQSINLFKKALKAETELEPENAALIYNALGYAYFAQDQYDLAIRQYKEALKLIPDYVTALNNLANIYEKKKLTAQALEMYEEALKVEPENTTAKSRAESLRKRFVAS